MAGRSEAFAKLLVRMELQTAQYDAALKKNSAQLRAWQKQNNSILGQMQRSFHSFGARLATIFGAAVLGAGIRAIVRQTIEAEKSFAQLDAAVKSTGGAAGFSTQQLVGMAKGLEKLTTFSDEAVMSMQAVLLSFTRIRGPEFRDAQLAILNLATRLGKDLPSAAIQVGKALNDPIHGLVGLQKAGVQLSESQKKTIKSLVETGHAADAQRIILGELETKFGEAAAAARNTFGGALEALKNAFHDLFEATQEGTAGAKEAVNNLTAALQDPAVIHGVQALTASVIELVGWLAKAVAGWTIMLSGKGGNVDVNRAMRIDAIKMQLDELSRVAILSGKTWQEQERILARIFPQAAEQIRNLREEMRRLQIQQDIALGRIPKSVFAPASEFANAPAGGREPPPLPKEFLEAQEKARLELLAMGNAVEKLNAHYAAQVAKIEELKDKYEELGPIADTVLANLAREHRIALYELEALESGLEKTIAVGKRFTVVNDTFVELDRTFHTARLSAEKLREELAAAAQVTESTFAAVEDNTRALNETFGEIKDRGLDLKPALDKIERDLDEANKKFGVFADEAARNMQDAFADYLFDPFDKGLKGMLKGFVDILRRMVANALAANIFGALGGSGGFGSILANLFGAGAAGAGGGGGGGGGGGLGLFSGTRATGGPVSPGKAFLVGERGPELFIPDTSGRIEPGGGMVVTQTNNIDARGATQDVIRLLPGILAENNRNFVAALRDGQSRGGF